MRLTILYLYLSCGGVVKKGSTFFTALLHTDASDTEKATQVRRAQDEDICQGKKGRVLFLALALTLTVTLSPNHLADKCLHCTVYCVPH